MRSTSSGTIRKAVVKLLTVLLLVQGYPLAALQESGVRAAPDPRAVEWLDGLWDSAWWPESEGLSGFADDLSRAWFRASELGAGPFAGAPQEEERGGGETKLPPDALAGPPDPPSFERTGERAPFPEGVELSLKAALDEIPLVPGWNLLSVPEAPAATDPATVLESAGAAYTHVNAYDGCDPVDPWKRYDPNDPEASDLQALDHTMGFWLDANLPVDLRSDGVLPPTTTFRLCAGWNLIGFPAAQARPVPNALASIDGKYVRLLAYEAFDPADTWKIYDVNVPGWANDLEVLEPGRGYWILVIEDVDLTIANEGPAPVASLLVPEDLAVVTAPTDVLGTVESAILEDWTLSYRAIGDGDWVEFASGVVPVTEGKLGVFDPTLLLNGLYEIRLVASDYKGRSVEDSIAVSVEGNMKIGNFTLSFVDLAVPLAGLDIEVIRNYDSRDKQQRDFGIGWTLEIRQGSYRNNRPPGEGWQILKGFVPCDTIFETKTHITTIKLSDREIYRFRLRISDAAQIAGGCLARAGFDFVDGPQPGSTLEVIDDPNVFYANTSDILVHLDSQETFEPNRVRLTTRDKRQFDLDLQVGVTTVRDRNGNSLRISQEGITHSSGKGVVFVRDAENRISSITDPSGNNLTYEYNATGNLVEFSDQEGNTDRFTYDANNLMINVDNPRGNAVRNDYDDSGRLVRVTDALGNTVELTHELGERRELIRDRLGSVHIYEYDQRGNVVKETDTTGKITLRTYDGHDHLLSETDPLGNTTRYAYDENSDLIALTDPLGKIARWTYNSLGKPLTALDPNGNQISYKYDTVGNLISVADPLENVSTHTYDANGNLTSTTDAEGNTTTWQYNAFGDRESQTDALGNATSYEYDLNGNQVTETKTRSTEHGIETVVNDFKYDKIGRLMSVTDAEGAVSTTVYDGMDNALAVTDPLDQTTEFAYDAVDRLTVIADPDGLSTKQFFNAEGKVIRQIGRGGKVTDVEYDPNNRLVSVTLPGVLSSRNILDDLGRPVGSVDALGESSTVDLDANGKAIRSVDALGRETIYPRDGNGNVLSVTEPGGQSTSIEYDALNRIVGVTAPDGTSVQTTYNPMGLIASQQDPLSRRTQFAYDAVGRLATVTDALDHMTSYTFDDLGSLTVQTDANGHASRLEYDKAGRVTRQTLADGKSETMEYDKAGNLITRTDFNGRKMSLRYGPYGPILERKLDNGETILYSYTPSGKRASVTDYRGTSSYVYDEPGRLSELIYPDGRRLVYSYDGVSRLTKLTAHIGQGTLETFYAYDALGRLIAITDPAGGVYSYTYTVAGDLETLSYPNGIVTTYLHDTLHQLTGLESRTKEGEVIQSYAYTLDAGGRRTETSEREGIIKGFNYDDLDRLTSESAEQFGNLFYQTTFSYDSVGNRLSLSRSNADGVSVSSYSYDSRDRLLSAGTTTHVWDANGNLTSRTDTENGVTVYTWDDQNRLRNIAMPDDTVVSHDYDADGSRVRTEVTLADGSKEISEYLVDVSGPLSRVVAETDSVGDPVASYVYGLGIGPVAAIRPDGVRYLHADGLGSTRILTDDEGIVTDRYSYTAFGELVEHIGEDSTQFLFAGSAYEVRTGLYDLQARWMDPRTGRFLSMDPSKGSLPEPKTQHPYLYAASDPVNKLDPGGRFYLSLAVIFHLNQPPPKGGTLQVQPNYFPLYFRVRPIVRSHSNWPPSYVLGRIDQAADVLGRKAGVIPYYYMNSIEYSTAFKLDMTTAEADRWMKEFFLRQYKGDGKTIPMLFFNQFRYERDLQGRAISPELEPSTKARGAVLPRFHSWLLGTSVTDGSLEPIWSPALEACRLAAAHELGHALGLPHADAYAKLLMSDGNCTYMDMTPDEISTVRRTAWSLR